MSMLNKCTKFQGDSPSGFNPLRTHRFPYKFASRRGFCHNFLLFTTSMTTCTFLERYFDREAYSVIKKIRKWNKMLTKITGFMARSKNVLVQLQASFERGFCNIFKCTRVLFLLLCLPKALRYHLTVYKHVCMVGNASISANRRIICGFTHIQVCCVRTGLKS